MRPIIIFTICIFLLYFNVLAEEVYYDAKYDFYDVDYFVQNPRLLNKYLDCFLDKGPCTPIGKVFKGE